MLTKCTSYYKTNLLRCLRIYLCKISQLTSKSDNFSTPYKNVVKRTLDCDKLFLLLQAASTFPVPSDLTYKQLCQLFLRTTVICSTYRNVLQVITPFLSKSGSEIYIFWSCPYPINVLTCKKVALIFCQLCKFDESLEFFCTVTQDHNRWEKFKAVLFIVISANNELLFHRNKVILVERAHPPLKVKISQNYSSSAI